MRRKNLKNGSCDCVVYCYLHRFHGQRICYKGDFGDCEKLSVREQREISKKILEDGFLEFFGEKLLWENVVVGEHGKPKYAKEGRFFNISHCHDGVAVALAGVPVGVDMEGSRRVKALTVRKCMDGKEKAYIGEISGENLSEGQMRRFFHLWTLKESYVKMTGEGIRMPLDQICFSLEGEPENVRKDSVGERRILYAENRVAAPWQKSSVSCLLPVPDHALALTLGWEGNMQPKVTYSFSDAVPKAR